MKNKEEFIRKTIERENLEQITRRHFLWECTSGMGAVALGSLFGSCNPFSRTENNPLLSANALAAKSPPFLSNDGACGPVCLIGGNAKGFALSFPKAE